MFAINGSSTNQVKSKMDIEHRVVDQFIHKAADLQEVGLGNPKVAFLFLTMSDFPWLKAWEAFFQDAWKKDYSIYVHRAALKDAELGPVGCNFTPHEPNYSPTWRNLGTFGRKLGLACAIWSCVGASGAENTHQSKKNLGN